VAVTTPASARLPVASRPVRRADVAPSDWNDWRWQLRGMLTSADELAQVIELSDATTSGPAWPRPAVCSASA
jgi:hypothetical protein